ncbi:PKD domain-containing protein [Egibacter rhizosphaerae]|uniref:alpha-amylase n=1 Tax=Egibacter rhizosphaerae TaxID=1670831 RepID=A0A411YHQ0_9ACTN|nr:Ig-like domain repeat protein [Egibacter rhizosphaerae]QBI20743.1 PKD domain-containing protein [Egibacter rhizosphaerae]
MAQGNTRRRLSAAAGLAAGALLTAGMSSASADEVTLSGTLVDRDGETPAHSQIRVVQEIDHGDGSDRRSDTIHDVADGTFDVEVDLEADADWTVVGEGGGPGELLRSAATTFSVAEGDLVDAPATIELQLQAPNVTLSVSGTASDAAGTVRALPVDTADPTFSRVHHDLTSFQDVELRLPDGTHLLYAKERLADEDGFVWGDATRWVTVTVEDGEATPADVEEPVDEPLLHGTVETPDGDVAGDHVSVQLHEEGLDPQLHTDLDVDRTGRFVASPPDADYVLQAMPYSDLAENAVPSAPVAVSVEGDGVDPPAPHDLALLDEAPVRGTVVDTGGAPLEGFFVELIRAGEDDPVMGVSTEDDGAFAFTPRDGDYQLQAFAPFDSPMGDSDPVTVEVDGADVEPEMPVELEIPDANVHGLVRSSDREPLADVEVEAEVYNEQTESFEPHPDGHGRTDDEGHFGLALPDGTYRLQPWVSEFEHEDVVGEDTSVEIEVDGGEVTPAPPIHLDLVPANVHGQLHAVDGADGDELSNMTVRVHDDEGSQLEQGSVDDEGYFALLVDEAAVELVATPTSGTPLAPTDPVELEVDGTDVIAPEMPLTIGVGPATVTGTVSDPFDAHLVGDAPRVLAHDADTGAEVAQTQAHPSTGDYALTLPDGEYEVRAEYIDPLWGASAGIDVTVEAGEAEPVTVDLEIAERNLVVEVLDTDGTPIDHADVTIVDDGDAYVTNRMLAPPDDGVAGFDLPEGAFAVEVDGQAEPVTIDTDGEADVDLPIVFTLAGEPGPLVDVEAAPDEGVAPLDSELTIELAHTDQPEADLDWEIEVLGTNGDAPAPTVTPSSGEVSLPADPITATVTFDEPDVATATVTATDPDGQEASAVVEISAHEQPPTATTTTLEAPSQVVTGEPFTLTAVVTDDEVEATIPEGDVTFSAAGLEDPVLGGAPVDADDGAATLEVDRVLPTGAHEITAAFSGGEGFSDSEDSTTIDVGAAETEVTVTTDDHVVDAGQEAVLDAAVSAAPPGAGTPAGEVAVVEVDDEQALVTGTLEGDGTATLAPELEPGGYDLAVEYQGSDAYAPAVSEPVAVQVRAPTETALASSPDAPVAGETVTLSVTVGADGEPVISGTVTFTADLGDGPTTLDTSGLNSQGVAEITVDELPVDTVEVTASYEGTDTFMPSEASDPVTVEPASTSVNLDADASTIEAGDDLALDADVTVDDPGAGTPAGEVTITRGDGATDVTSVELDGGTASVTVDDLPVGEHELVASYPGSDRLLGGDSDPVAVTVRAPTTTGLTLEPADEAPFGRSVTATAAVEVDASEPIEPAGSVVFEWDGDATTVAPEDGVATAEIDGLDLGQHDIEAAYAGDDLTGPSDDTASIDVVPATTQTELTVEPIEPVTGEEVELTAAIGAERTAVTEGSVTFERVDANVTDPLGEADVDSQGEASVTTSELPPGTPTVVARYEGPAEFVDSEDDRTLTVEPAATATTLSATPRTVGEGDPIDLDAVVEVDAPGGGTAEGELEIVAVPDEPVATGDLDGGALSVETTELAVGTHELVAEYAGSSAYEPSESDPVEVTVEAVDTDPPEPSLTASPTGGLAPHEVEFDITIEGSTAEAPWVLDTSDGSDPTEGQDSEQVTHTFEEAGSYPVRLTAEDDDGNAASTVVTVEVADPDSLVARGGDDRAVDAGAELTLDGSASTPGPTIADYAWEFGDGHSAEGETVTHTFDEPGTYDVVLTVETAVGVDTDEITVEALDPAPEGLVVEVLGEGQALEGAPVVVEEADGTQRNATTDDDGEAVLRGLPPGEVVVYTGTDEFLPDVAEAEVADDGRGEVTIDLEAGEPLEGEVDAERLDESEIEEHGLDPNDPENQHVWQADINLRVRGFDVGGNVVFGGAGGVFDWDLPDWTCEQDRCSRTIGGYQHVMRFGSTGSGQPGSSREPHLTYIVIPIEGRFLKEFFDVEFTVLNLAPAGFEAKDMTARLPLPEGLSLAPIAGGQSSTVEMGDIPGGEQRTANWVVRGDASGHYDLEATATGVLDPLGATVDVVARAEEPLHVWGADALQLLVEPDEAVWTRNPMGLRLGFENVADIDVYNTQITLLEETENAVYQPRQPRELRLGTIPAGEQVWAPTATLVPAVSGEIVEHESYVSEVAGSEIPDADISTVEPMRPPAETYDLRTFSRREHVVLAWDEVRGADDYELYSTEDLNTQFPDERIDGEEVRERVVAIPREEDKGASEWAVSTSIDGDRELFHPVSRAGATSTPTSPSASLVFTDGQRHLCGGSATLEAAFSDEILDLTGYEIEIAEWEEQSGDLSGRSDTVQLDTFQADDLPDAGLEVRARAQDELGTWGEWGSVTLRPDCPGEDVVVLAAGLFSRVEEGDERWRERFGRPNDTHFESVVGQLTEFGYELGHLGAGPYEEPNRTILEFSYNGANVRQTDEGPIFEPVPYSRRDTVSELQRTASEAARLLDMVDPSEWIGGAIRSTGEEYLDALIEYDRAWYEAHGEWLRFHFVGHSLGGRQVLNIASAAASRADDCEGETTPDGYPCERFEDLVGSVITVNGAVYPATTVQEIDVVSCLTSFNQWWVDRAFDELDRQTVQVRANAERVADPLAKVEKPVVERDLGRIGDSATRVNTLGTPQDSCMPPDVTVADHVHPHVEGSTHTVSGHGLDAHHVLLDGGTPERPTDWMPVRSLIRDRLGPAGGTAPVELDTAPRQGLLRPQALTGGPAEIAGTLTDPGGAPLDGGEVVVLDDADGVDLAPVESDGSFVVEGLAPGQYRVFSNPLVPGQTGGWLGGPELASAERFELEAGETLDLGEIAGEPTHELHVSVEDPDGQAPTGLQVSLRDTATDTAAGRAGVDADGDLTFNGVVAGTYEVTTSAPGWAESSTTVEVPATNSVDLVVEPAPFTAVRVVDGEGDPLPFVDAELRDDQDVVARTVTGVDGVAVFPDVEEETYVAVLSDEEGLYEGVTSSSVEVEGRHGLTRDAIVEVEAEEPESSPGPSPPPGPDDDPEPEEDPEGEPETDLGQLTVSRLSGDDRYETAATIARDAYEGSTDTVYVATGEEFADALTGGPAAHADRAPVLLTRPDRLPEATVDAIDDLAPDRIAVLGGEQAVSGDVTDELEAEAEVERVAGADRFETAAEIATTTFEETAEHAYIATGREFADALAGGVPAAVEGAPVLLVEPDALPEATVEALESLEVETVTVLGGPSAVDPDVIEEVELVVPGEVDRRAGDDRFETAVEIADALDESTEAFVTTGRVFADALAGVPAAAAIGAPVLLVEPDGAPPAAVRDAVAGWPLDAVTVLGGKAAVASETVDALEEIVERRRLDASPVR